MAVEFSPSEIRAYYSARIPATRQARAMRWRGRCPIHGGKGPNLSVNLETGQWYCFSQCGRGGGIVAFELALGGGSPREAWERAMVAAGRVHQMPQPGRSERRATARTRADSTAWFTALTDWLQGRIEALTRLLATALDEAEHERQGARVAVYSRSLRRLRGLGADARHEAYIAAWTTDPEGVTRLLETAAERERENRTLGIVCVRLLEEADLLQCRRSV